MSFSSSAKTRGHSAKARLVVMQFPRWRARLSPLWQAKIERNRKRDARTFAKLRRAGWTIVRIWEHEVQRDIHGCVDRIAEVVARHPRSRS